MSRTKKDVHFLSDKSLARMSNHTYKRQRAHKERMLLRNELADLERYEDDLDHEFVKWNKHMAKRVHYNF